MFDPSDAAFVGADWRRSSGGGEEGDAIGLDHSRSRLRPSCSAGFAPLERRIGAKFGVEGEAVFELRHNA